MEWFNLDDDCFSLCKMQMLAGVRIYVKIISYTLIQPLGYERIYERQLFVYIVLLLVITNFKMAFFYSYNSSTSKNSICTNSIKQSWNKLWLKVLRLLLSVLRAKKKRKEKKLANTKNCNMTSAYSLQNADTYSMEVHVNWFQCFLLLLESITHKKTSNFPKFSAYPNDDWHCK